MCKTGTSIYTNWDIYAHIDVSQTALMFQFNFPTLQVFPPFLTALFAIPGCPSFFYVPPPHSFQNPFSTGCLFFWKLFDFGGFFATGMFGPIHIALSTLLFNFGLGCAVNLFLKMHIAIITTLWYTTHALNKLSWPLKAPETSSQSLLCCFWEHSFEHT